MIEAIWKFWQAHSDAVLGLTNAAGLIWASLERSWKNKERKHRVQLQRGMIADVAAKHKQHQPNPAVCNCGHCSPKGKH